MKIRNQILTQNTAGFDLVRLSKSKSTVDICPNTIRAYAREGLNLYRRGRAVFFSRAELQHFLVGGAPRQEEKGLVA